MGVGKPQLAPIGGELRLTPSHLPVQWLYTILLYTYTILLYIYYLRKFNFGFTLKDFYSTLSKPEERKNIGKLQLVTTCSGESSYRKSAMYIATGELLVCMYTSTIYINLYTSSRGGKIFMIFLRVALGPKPFSVDIYRRFRNIQTNFGGLKVVTSKCIFVCLVLFDR